MPQGKTPLGQGSLVLWGPSLLWGGHGSLGGRCSQSKSRSTAACFGVSSGMPKPAHRPPNLRLLTGKLEIGDGGPLRENVRESFSFPQGHFFFSVVQDREVTLWHQTAAMLLRRFPWSFGAVPGRLGVSGPPGGSATIRCCGDRGPKPPKGPEAAAPSLGELNLLWAPFGAAFGKQTCFPLALGLLPSADHGPP